MGAKTASLAILSAAVAGGTLRLLLYPQFVFGLGLIVASMLIKLSRNPADAIVATICIIAVALVLFVFHDPLVHALRRSAPKVARFTKVQARNAQEGLTKAVQITPLWIYTLLGFAVPALAQFLGSMSTVRMLSSVDVKPITLPGASFIIMFSLVYLGTLTLGISESWLKPSKVSFLLQSVWVIGALFSSSAADLRFNENLPSVLAGWGGFIIGLTPGAAVVGALKTAAASAALAGAGVAIHVRAIGSANRMSVGSQNPEIVDFEDEVDQVDQAEVAQEAVELKELDNELHEFSKGRRHLSVNDVINEWKMWADNNIAQLWETGTSMSLNNLRKRRGSSKSSRSPRQSLKGKQSINGSEQEGQLADASEIIEAETEEIEGDLRESGLDAKDFVPPMKYAALITLFRATPTCLSLTISLALSLLSTATGKFRVGMLMTPVVLAPFALGELISLKRRIGVWDLVQSSVAPTGEESELNKSFEDGVALLLWESPFLLRAWKSLVSLSEHAQNPSSLVEAIKEAPIQFLDPDQEAMDIAPPLTKWIVGKLLLSIVLDIIGASSYAIPMLGEITDFAYAPLQAYLVHHMYGISWLSWVSMFEEILPFTDVLPSATLGFVVTYGPYFPVWFKRGIRMTQEYLPAMHGSGLLWNYGKHSADKDYSSERMTRKSSSESRASERRSTLDGGAAAFNKED